MIPYLILSISPIILSLFIKDLNENDSKKRKLLVVLGIMLFILLGLRHQEIGSTDTLNYCNNFEKAVNVSNWSGFYNPNGVEYGFQLSIFLISRIFNNSQWLVVLTSLLYVVSTMCFIYKNSKNVTLSFVAFVTLGLMQFQMQGMRQSIAMSICLFAFEFAKKQKLLPFVLTVLLAMQFHRTAILFLVVYIVFKMNYNWKSMTVVCAITVLIWIFSDELIVFGNEIFDSDYQQGYGGNYGGYVATAIYIVLVILALIANERLKHDRLESSILFVTIIGTCLYISRYLGVSIVERLSFYFQYGQIILLSNTIVQFKKRDAAFLSMIAYIIMIALFMYRLDGSFVPYKFFWQQ